METELFACSGESEPHWSRVSGLEEGDGVGDGLMMISVVCASFWSAINRGEKARNSVRGLFERLLGGAMLSVCLPGATRIRVKTYRNTNRQKKKRTKTFRNVIVKKRHSGTFLNFLKLHDTFLYNP
jgi:hypothetical protein